MNRPDDHFEALKVICLAVVVLVILGVGIFGGLREPNYGCRKKVECKGEIVQECKPALRGSWDQGPTVHVDKTCKNVCKE